MDHQEKTTEKHTEYFEFSGSAREYLSIWFVNNMLTWLTLGIYSAWAKVRTLQYFYGSTELAEGTFQFTANPLVILRGRVIAVALFVLYFVVDAVESTLANVVFYTLLCSYFVFAPVLTIFVMSFKMRYSQWRGINFYFNKDFKGAYRVYLLPITLIGLILLGLLIPYYSAELEEFMGYESPVFSYNSENAGADEYQTSGATADFNTDTYGDDVNQDIDSEQTVTYTNPYFYIPSGVLFVAFLLLLPFFDFINTRFLSRNVRLGVATFSFVAVVKDYYLVYAKWLVATAVLAGVWLWEAIYGIMSNIDVLWILVVVTVLYIPASRAYLKSRRYNLLLNNTIIDGKHRLQANTPFLKMLLLMITNSVGIALTLGLLTPWAQVRTVRFLLTHSSLVVDGSLDDFVARQHDELNALGEEIADVFDLELIG